MILTNFLYMKTKNKISFLYKMTKFVKIKKEPRI